MRNALPYIQIVLSILLTASILLQQRGSSAGSAFGSDSSSYSSRRGVEKYLFIGTIILGIAFVVSASIPLFLQ